MTDDEFTIWVDTVFKQEGYGMANKSRSVGRSVSAAGAYTAGYDPLDDDFLPDEMPDRPDDVDADLSTLGFSQEIKILLIQSASWRIVCSFLGFDSVTSVKEAPYSNITLIGLLAQQNVMGFMESQGYKFQGEIAFDQHENPIPCTKHCWMLKDKEVSFTSGGFMFFEHPEGVKDRHKNVILFAWRDSSTGNAGFHVYSDSTEKSKQITQDIETYTKKHNCLRGAKIRDVNMITATFEEVKVSGKHTWENYYFSKSLRDMFDLEVFGFLKNVERYNARNISKRGVLMYGPPGTGKTTIGHLICNYATDHTVIWITPDLIAENNSNKHSIKLLYMLADFVAPSVIMLEDLDLFSEDREGVVDQLRLGALMNILDGVNTVKNAVTIATTNRLELIEKALSNRPGRFDRLVEIPALEEHLRRKMVKARLADSKIEDKTVENIVRKTDGWTPAELQEFINSLNLHFINLQQENDQVITDTIVETVFEIVTKYCRKGASRKVAGFGG